VDHVLEPETTGQPSGPEAPVPEDGFFDLPSAGFKPREIRYQKGPLP